MERIMSDYEKIKKAEEIYNRRKMRGVGGVRLSNPTIERYPKKELSNIGKMLFQICFCIFIYAVVYIAQNSNNLFSEQFMKTTKELLTYDMNFRENITKLIDNINSFIAIPSENIIENSVVEEAVIEEENSVSENIVNEIDMVVDAEKENTIEEVVEEKEEVAPEPEKTQMELDAEYIMKNYDLKLPVKGEITSPYGERTIAPTFHVGVDIGADTGTSIVSAMDGVATQVSTVGDYGYHIRITSGDLTTLYAHCSKLNIKEGQKIKAGEKIAEAGETGNATGPHLHFEVIYQRKIC